jgi:hypothetical protein
VTTFPFVALSFADLGGSSTDVAQTPMSEPDANAVSHSSNNDVLFALYKHAARDENAAVSRLEGHLKGDSPTSDMRRELTIEMLEAHERVCDILEHLERLHLDQ